MKTVELYFAVAEFQKDLSKFVHNLSCNVEYEAKIVGNDWIKSIINAICHHEKNISSRKEGCQLLRKLALNDNEEVGVNW